MKLTDLRPAKGAKPRASASAGAKAQGSEDLRQGEQGAQGAQRRRDQAWIRRRADASPEAAPKRGFVNVFREEMAIVNVKELNRFKAGSVVDAEALRREGLVKGSCPGGVKLLGNGEVTRKLNVKVDRASKAAVGKVVAAGGTVEV